jgi:hypothetical protein
LSRQRKEDVSVEQLDTCIFAQQLSVFLHLSAVAASVAAFSLFYAEAAYPFSPLPAAPNAAQAGHNPLRPFIPSPLSTAR